MKIALVHYWLTNMRGGEKVLSAITDLYPHADIFTHAYNSTACNETFGHCKISETFIGKLPGGRKFTKLYLPLMPSALQRLDLSDYDLIISSESGPAKGFFKPPKATHICYCHTPMRYIWDLYDDYYNQAGCLSKIGMKLFTNYLRKYDLQSANQVDYFIANSKFVQERIRRIYHRDATVIYPPVDTDFFSRKTFDKQDYYIFAGQLVSYKKADLALAACQKLKRKIIIVGSGGLKNTLQKKYAGIAQFTGRVSNEELRQLYGKARGLIFPGIEDFGIVPLEAQACGTPVIALGIGGALETVKDHETGIFFETPTVPSLCDQIVEFEKINWNYQLCQKQAIRFSKKAFLHQFRNYIKEVIEL